MRDLVWRPNLPESQDLPSADLGAREGGVAEADAVQVDPGVLDRMDRVRFRDGLVTVHIVLKDDYRPKPPWSEPKLQTFTRLMQGVLDRVDGLVGEYEPSDSRPTFEAVEMQGYRGACALSVRVRALDELLKQPEVGACLDWHNFPPETSPR